MVCLMLCILLSSVIKADPWFHVRKWGGEAGHTSFLHSFEVARSLDQSGRGMHLYLHGFYELLTTPIPSPPVECLYVLHVIATGQPGVTYLKVT